ncbi:hypothetical protein [Paenibacillus graminis]|uniref:hypothetical protein n=1 Tax=Paenibacillus graminis TaxID=189425 RepID=UPI002DB7A817|nr:hypothetical protein [Paenibacillus graminis]MEC0169889.1 hypothetical protein [Paenibacillus graminis]
MSNLKLIMSQGNKTAELEIEHSDEKQRNDAVMGLFRFFGYKGPQVVTGGSIGPELISSLVTKEAFHTKHREPKEAPTATQKNKPASQPPLSAGEVSATVTPEPYKPEKPPLIHSERTLQMPIGEITGSASVDAVSTEPEHYKTGIKYKDGVPHYKMRYWCQNPKCRDKANDYIPVDQMVVNCRQCGMALTVMPAAPKGERDGYGNYFIANRPATGAEG